MHRHSIPVSTQKVDSMPPCGVVRNRHARSVGRGSSRARARVYIGIFVAVYHFCACPPFTPHHGLFKVSRRRRRARACARAPPDVGQQAVTGLAPAVLPNRHYVCGCDRLLVVCTCVNKAFCVSHEKERARART